jgi:hypothetical protein
MKKNSFVGIKTWGYLQQVTERLLVCINFFLEVWISGFQLVAGLVF